jgi:hypothetical protein
MIRTTLAEAPKLSELAEAALRGEEVLITTDCDGKESVLKLVVESPTEPEDAPQVIKAGSAKGLFIMSDDFDEPLEDFEEYMR